MQQNWNKSIFGNETTTSLYDNGNETFNYVIFTILVFVIPGVLFGNIMVIIAIFKFKKLRTCMNLLLANLAASDLLVGFPTAPLYAVTYISPVLRHNRWLCLFKCMAVIASFSSSLLSLSAISIERFIAVFYPLHYSSWITKKRIKIAILVSWCYIIPISITPLLGLKPWHDGRICGIFELLPKPLTLTCHVVNLAICFPVAAVLFTVITLKIRKVQRRHNRSISDQSGHLTCNPRVESDKRAGIMMAYIFLLFIIFWSPSIIAIPLKYILPDQSSIEDFKNLSVVMAMGNSFVNPAVYCWCKTELKTAFITILLCKEKIPQDPTQCQTSRGSTLQRHQNDIWRELSVVQLHEAVMTHMWS